jgi:hypothetical protein
MRNYRASTMMKIVPASTLEAEAPQATTSFIAAVQASWVEGEIISE